MTPTTEAGRTLLDKLYEFGGNAPSDVNDILAIEAEARADILARLRADVKREVPERLPSGSHRYDRERAAFNEGRAAVLAIIDRAAQKENK